jgi:hypothetical protein
VSQILTLGVDCIARHRPNRTHCRSPRFKQQAVTPQPAKCGCCERTESERAVDAVAAVVAGKAVVCPTCRVAIPRPEARPAVLHRIAELTDQRSPRRGRHWSTIPLHLVGYSGSGSMFHKGRSGRRRVF